MTSRSQKIRPGIMRLAVLMCIPLLTGCQNAVTTSEQDTTAIETTMVSNQMTSQIEITMTSVRASPLIVTRPTFDAKSIEEADSVSVGDHITFGNYPQRKNRNSFI